MIGTVTDRTFQQYSVIGTVADRTFQHCSVIGTVADRTFQQYSVTGTVADRTFQHCSVIGTVTYMTFQHYCVIHNVTDMIFQHSSSSFPHLFPLLCGVDVSYETPPFSPVLRILSGQFSLRQVVRDAIQPPPLRICQHYIPTL